MTSEKKKGEKQTETSSTKKEKKEEKKGHSQIRYVLLILILITLLFLVFFFVILPNLSLNVPFSTFKSNFYSAGRVALLVTYHNTSQSVVEEQCYTQMLQLIAHSKPANTIDFYLLNATRCTYPIGGLGHTLTLGTNSSSNCIGRASGEPDIFLNYSSSNQTVVTAYRLYVYGNSQYMASCPIAVEIS